MSRCRTDKPADGTLRSRRSRELEALGYLTDRATYPADALRLLAAAGYISDRMATACGRPAREARSQALTDFLAIALFVLEAELLQPVPKPMSVAGYSLRNRRD